MRFCSTRSWPPVTRSSSSSRRTTGRCAVAPRNRGADAQLVELEHDGIDTVALERLLEDGLRPKLAHIIPNFQNPAGYTLSAAKRQRLLELARQYEFTVFEDDPYVALRFEGESLSTMVSIDAGGRRLRVLVLQNGLSRDPVRLPPRARGPDRADRQERDQRLHIAEHGRCRRS